MLIISAVQSNQWKESTTTAIVHGLCPWRWLISLEKLVVSPSNTPVVAVVVVSLRFARSPPFCHGPFGKGAGFSSTKLFQFLAPNQLVLFGSELELVVIESNRCIVAKKSWGPVLCTWPFTFTWLSLTLEWDTNAAHENRSLSKSLEVRSDNYSAAPKNRNR